MKVCLCFVVICLVTQAHLQAQIEPKAGTWKTWVIPSGEAYRLLPPPDAIATQAELKTLLSLQSKRDSAAISQIKFWNAGAPGYRWQGVIEQLYAYFPPGWGRGKALLNVAIYDATIAAWHTKYLYKRPRPSVQNTALTPYLPNPDSPSYPCEHSVTDGAAAAILAYLFPAKADSIRKVAEEAVQSRLLAGVVYPSDVKAGFELGQRVAQAVIELAKTDRADAVWDGKRPTGANLWNDKRPPFTPMLGHCKPWALTACDQFRPGPPPDPTEGMKELKNAKKSPAGMYKALFWASGNYWSDETNHKIFENNLHLNAPRAARVYALVSVAAQDAAISCFDAKYTYWAIRPNQYDTTYAPFLPVTPAHPSYPSGHATLSRAQATVLSYLFPEDTQLFISKAREAAESRFEGGIHFRVDNEVGLDMGRKVGEEIIKRARQDRSAVAGADAPSVLVNK